MAQDQPVTFELGDCCSIVHSSSPSFETLAFTTTSGAGGTSLIGTSGVDTTAFDPGTLSQQVYIGAQGDADIINLQSNPATNYSIYGGSGNDTINAAGFTTSTVKLDDGNDTITITGVVRSSTVSGLNGLDTITLTGGVNSGLINGNNDSDTININGSTLQGSTVIAGGQGGDTINIGGAGGLAVTFTGGRVNGQDGADTITVVDLAAAMAVGSSSINGGQGSDNITNSDAGNLAMVAYGDLGNDTLTGAAGRDTLFGGEGDDRMVGSGGADSLSGGSGSDFFVQANDASVDASAQSATAGANWVANSTITFATGTAGAVDVITDFTGGTGGDVFAVGGTATGTLATALLNTNIGTGAGGTGTAATANTVYYASGNWNANTGVFTFTANGAGSDTLLIMGSGATAATASILTAGTDGSAVLVGTNYNTLTAANF